MLKVYVLYSNELRSSVHSIHLSKESAMDIISLSDGLVLDYIEHHTISPYTVNDTYYTVLDLIKYIVKNSRYTDSDILARIDKDLNKPLVDNIVEEEIRIEYDV